MKRTHENLLALMMDACAIASHRSGTYWLLSRAAAEAPAPGLLAAILESAGALDRADRPVDPDLARWRDAAYEAHAAPERLSELVTEFTRLFEGISRRDTLPPIESAVREGRAPGDNALAVARLYLEAGYPRPYPDAGPVDHLATELRFLSLTSYAEAQSWRSGDPASARRWLARQQRFLDEHVLAWVPHYCAGISARTATTFYAAFARLIAHTCVADGREIRQTLRHTSPPAEAVPGSSLLTDEPRAAK